MTQVEPYEYCCQQFDETGDAHSYHCPNHVPVRKRLFHPQCESFTDAGQELDREVGAALRPIIARYFGMGYSSRDIFYIINAATSIEEMMVSMIYNADSTKKQNELRAQRREAKRVQNS